MGDKEACISLCPPTQRNRDHWGNVQQRGTLRPLPVVPYWHDRSHEEVSGGGRNRAVMSQCVECSASWPLRLWHLNPLPLSRCMDKGGGRGGDGEQEDAATFCNKWNSFLKVNVWKNKNNFREHSLHANRTEIKKEKCILHSLLHFECDKLKSVTRSQFPLMFGGYILTSFETDVMMYSRHVTEISECIFVK